jgi:hypothetical protein
MLKDIKALLAMKKQMLWLKKELLYTEIKHEYRHVIAILNSISVL